jgi:Cys-rich protein (TIGR01571 family)
MALRDSDLDGAIAASLAHPQPRQGDYAQQQQIQLQQQQIQQQQQQLQQMQQQQAQMQQQAATSQAAASQSAAQAQAMQRQQVVQAAQAQGFSNEWSNGLLGCCDAGAGTCLYTFCCPSCALATARSKLDSSSWTFNCCCLTTCLGYNIIREGYRIEGNCCTDIIKSVLCPCCVTAQMLQEVNTRGGYNYVNRGGDGEEDWKFHTFSCFDKFESCIYAFCCPYCALADARASYDGSDCM